METSVFWPDLIIVCIIAMSAAISFVRGFIKEVISLVSWVLSAWFAFILASPMSSLITFVEIESLRTMIAFMILFIGLVFLGALVNFMVGRVIRKTPFSLPDRMLGVGFGFLRGILVVTLIIFFAGLTPVPQDEWWQRSFTVSQFEKAAVWLKDRLPENMAKHFEYEPKPKPVTEQA